jgi:DUF4097 and DUF4098 domain-containing protein YvlB
MIASYADRIKGDSNREKMMNKYVMTLIGIFCTTAVAAEDINETMDADARSAVHISNIAGSVEVSGWSRNEVELSGELGSGVEELIFERDGDEIIIQVKARQHNSRNISSDLVVKVPKMSSLRINAVSADIEIDNVEGEQRLQSVSGDIETSAFAEDIEIESVSGDVEVDGDGKAMRSRFNTVSGDIETEKLSGEISAESVSGDLVVANGDFSRAFVHTVNGEIVYHAKLQDGGRLDIETINGEVDIDFGGDVSARFDVETFNGEIRNCFGPEAVRTSQYTPGVELKFTEGDGAGRVTIQTLNGDIGLCK